MNQWVRGISAAGISFLLLISTGCGGSSGKPQLRIMNAVFRQSVIDVLLDGNTIQSSLAFENNSGYLPESAGMHTLQFNQPGTSVSLGSQSITLNTSTNYTVIAVAPFSTFGLTQMFLTDDNSAPSSGNIKIRIANSSQTFTSLDIYIVTPGTSIGTVSATISDLASLTASSYQSLPVGTYEIFFTPHNQKAIVSDSGAISFGAGENRTFVDFDVSNGISSVELADLN